MFFFVCFSLIHEKLLGSFFLRLSVCVLLSIVRIFRSLVYKALCLVFSMISTDLVVLKRTVVVDSD